MTSNLNEKIDQLTDQILKNKKCSNSIVDLLKYASEVGFIYYFFQIHYYDALNLRPKKFSRVLDQSTRCVKFLAHI